MTHTSFSEDHLSRSPLAPWGKGREGKRKGRGRESGRDFSIHLTFRTARAATARSDGTQPARVRTGMDGATRINGGHR